MLQPSIVLLSARDLERLLRPETTIAALRDTYAALADNRADQGRSVGFTVEGGSIHVKSRLLSGSHLAFEGVVDSLLGEQLPEHARPTVARASKSSSVWLVLYKTVNGVRSSLDLVGQKDGYGVKTAVPANQWHTLRVGFAGARFNVVFNGKPLFTVEDATFPEAGMVGIWTKADSVTVFSGFTYGQQQ